MDLPARGGDEKYRKALHKMDKRGLRGDIINGRGTKKIRREIN